MSEIIGSDPGRGEAKNWLIGAKIALAFRATHVPKGRLLVIEENVAKLVDRYKRHGDFNTSDLCFSESLPFSPFKGFETPFPIGEKGEKWKQTGWNGHFFLRSVSKKQGDALVLDRQRITAFFRFMWEDDGTGFDADDPEVRKRASPLRNIEAGAGYLRSIAAVRQEGLSRCLRRREMW